ncbi:MAG TPA: PhoD-like phosphatase N-terminal domain-containing protein, partial [Acidimicrobiales bacterium]|nr:PhoD-like phosphatase N-terminal domain-containing protein [Acidimicrobiales bacterium]
MGDDRHTPHGLSRRRFLTGAGSALVVAPFVGRGRAGASRNQPTLPEGLFSLGVASGDPLHQAVVLWTRLAPDPLEGGAMPAVDVPVAWEVARDE